MVDVLVYIRTASTCVRLSTLIANTPSEYLRRQDKIVTDGHCMLQSQFKTIAIILAFLENKE